MQPSDSGADRRGVHGPEAADVTEQALALVAAYEKAKRAYCDQVDWSPSEVGEITRLSLAWQRAEQALIEHCQRHGTVRTPTGEYKADKDADLMYRRFMGPTVRGLVR